MTKKKRPIAAPKTTTEDKPTTLKDLLSPQILSKLKEQADEMKAEEARAQEEKRKQAEDARKAEQKRLEGDFGHLLENSSLDWKKYK
jgi:hypothetical protein